MLFATVVLTALLAGSTTASPRSTKQELIGFMRSRSLDPKIMANAAKTSRTLTQSIKDKAVMVPPGRKLEDAAADYNNNNNNEQYYSRNYIQGSDDAYGFSVNADWQNDWGFDASQYSLSYERCATVKQFDIEKAAEEDATSPFRTQHFAVLRLCPAKTCDNPDWYEDEEESEEEGQEQEAEAEAEAEDEAEDEAEAEAEAAAEEYAEVYGATGRGCSSNYATFLLDAGQYMGLMADYEDTQFEMYCNYCDHYMQQAYQKWIQNGGHRQLEFEDFKNDHEVQRMLGGDMDACSVMSKACGNGFQDNYADLLDCAEVQKNNGMVAYTQATCAEDGQTITIGLYSDEECSEDITSNVNMANWIGEEVNDEEMAHYYKNVATAVGELIESYGGKTNVNLDNLCMPCAAQDQAWFLAGDDDNSGSGEIAEICDAVFSQSARCDKTLSNWWRHKTNPYYAQSNALQDLSCAYIDNMRMGKFDTEGNVIMDANRLYLEAGEAQGINGNLYMQEYGQGLAEVSPLQIFLLVLSISACAILAAWSSTLHKTLTKKWKPRQTDEVTRQDSGIVVGRSKSNHSSYYMS